MKVSSKDDLKQDIFNLNGVVAVINTTFTKENQIDYASITRYVENAIESGASGFLVPAMAAELNKLTPEERKFIVKTVVESANKNVPVIGGASADTQNERINYIKELEEIGCKGVLVSIPFENEDKYKNMIREIAQEVHTFLVIQDWDFHGFGIPVNVIVDLFEEVEVFKSLKVEVTPAGKKYSDVLAATGGHLHVSGGWASSQMIEALDRGVHTFMSTIMHQLYKQIFDFHHTGQREKAKEVFQKIVPILAFSHQHVDISIHFNKRFYYKQGIFQTDKVRDPIIPFDDYHKKVADELIEQAIDLQNKISP
jgi:4-hydroxy-tetrahydrodipicolinate synthase